MFRGSIGESTLTQASDTDPYGIIWRDLLAAGSETDPHGYTGQEREDGLDMMVYGARFYMPETGRFLQVDPAREFANPYSYVGNNPIEWFDSTGMQSAREIARENADYYFGTGHDGLGYFWSGFSGFLSITDNLSKVVDHHFVKKRDDVTRGTYGWAIIESLDVVPLGKLAGLLRNARLLEKAHIDTIARIGGARLRQISNMIPIKKTKNVAVALMEIGGDADELIATNGSFAHPGTIDAISIDQRVFSSVRDFDSEALILEGLPLDTRKTGMLRGLFI